MRFYVAELKINGVKSINKEIDLKFCNSTLKSSFDIERTNIKAIYGPNGAGKSAIMTAMYIYKRIICDEDGLTDKFFANFVKETINKLNKKLEIEVTFIFYDEDSNEYYDTIRHLLVLSTTAESVFVEKEKLYVLSGKSISNDKFREKIGIENGKLILLDGYTSKKMFNSVIYNESINLLNKHSVLCVADALEKKINETDLIESIIVITRYFASNIIVSLETEDLHYEFISDRLFIETYKGNNSSDCSNSDEEFLFDLSVKDYDEVDVDCFGRYQIMVNKLCKFIKVFKQDLNYIEIEKKINNDKYFCKKIMHYEDDYLIDIEFESTGIKKLVRLYNSLFACSNGRIVFIDEFDANLHDVYFAKLVEFMKIYAKGQLCFTTHNLEPIDILKSNSHSLDFLSDNSMITSWKRDGNTSPLKKYVNGLIEYSTFNVESVDFIQSLIDGD